MAVPDVPSVPHDLPPCGDVDLQTDNENCGSCGHECYIQDIPISLAQEWSGGGSCSNGTCGPVWAACGSYQFGSTCRELVEAEGFTCASGCPATIPDATALFWHLEMDLGGTCFTTEPTAELTLGCDEPLPWTPGQNEHVMCCVAPP